MYEDVSADGQIRTHRKPTRDDEVLIVKLSLHGLLVALLLAACSKNNDAFVVLSVDSNDAESRALIQKLQVTVDDVTRDYVLHQELPATLGIETSKTGKVAISVVGLGAKPLGKWSGSVSVIHGRTIEMDVVLACDTLGCGSSIEGLDASVSEDSGVHQGRDAPVADAPEDIGRDGRVGSGTGGKGGLISPPTPCTNLRCQQSTCSLGNCTVQCPNGERTTVSGRIYDPAGKIPLFNITVYVPNGPLDDIEDGPSCDPCNAATGTSLLSGQPIALTKTDETGTFHLGTIGTPDVPAGSNIPLVIQDGKWRRQIMVPTVTACMDTMLTDINQTRLPRTQAEGHIPKMALTTGQSDAMECLLRKIGLDDSEFTTEAGTGRVNLYMGGAGAGSFAPTLNAGASFTPANPWWDSLDNLKMYDLILHSCEGSYGAYDPKAVPPQEPMSVKSVAARRALEDFANLGGRVFASHYHTYWFEQSIGAFKSIGTFNHRAGLGPTYDATIDQSFDTGSSLAKWMINVQGSTTLGIVNITQDAATRMIDMAAGGNISQRWIYASTLTPQSVQFLSATTPIPTAAMPTPQACGRAVVSDLHVSTGGAAGDQPNMPFPTGCITTDLSPREKVLEFMLFDIANCVQPVGL